MAKLKNTYDTAQSILNEAMDKTARAWKTLLYGYDGSAWKSLHVDTDGDLQVDLASIIGTASTVNSSSTPLGIGGVFTGTSEDVKDYGSIIIATKSDVASATNGLSIQFSTDGTNWDHIDAHTIPAATSHTLTIAPQARYFRIVYTNGGTAQTSFRLQAIFRPTAVGPQMETLSGDVSDTNFALTTRAVLAAKKPDTTYTNIQATAGGNLKVSIEEAESTAIIPVAGTIAHDSPDSGNPVKVGFKAVLFNQTAPPAAAVAEDDRVNGIADEYGRQYINDVHPNFWDVSVDYASAQTNASVKAAPGAGLSLYITDISISNGAVAGNITLLDGSGGTVKYEIYPAINGGAVDNKKTPIKLTANTALCITSTTVTTHSLNISGFIAP